MVRVKVRVMVRVRVNSSSALWVSFNVLSNKAKRGVHMLT